MGARAIGGISDSGRQFNITPRQLVTIIIFGGLIMLPALFNTIAAVPVNDDFCFSAYINHNFYSPSCAIAESPPQWAQESRIFSFLVARYIGWSGRFTADLLTVLWLILPISYVGMLYILFFAQFAIIYLFFRTLSPSTATSIALTVSAIAIFLLITPEINETAYWILAILTHNMAAIVFALFCVYVVRLFSPHYWGDRLRNRSHLQTTGYALSLAVCAVLLCGFNEMFMVVLLLLATTMVICTYRHANRTLSIAILIGTVIGIALVIGSPGNGTRAAFTQRALVNNIPFTLLATAAVTMCYGALFTVLLLVLHLLRPFRKMMQLIRQHHIFLFSASASYAYVMICIAYLLVPAAVALPLTWVLGNVGPLRAHSQIILTMLLLLPLAYNSLFVLITRGTIPLLNRVVHTVRAHGQRHRAVIMVVRSALMVPFFILVVFGMPIIGQAPESASQSEFITRVTEYKLRTAQIVNLAIAEYFRGNLFNSYSDALYRTIPYVREIRQRQRHVSAAAAHGVDVVFVPPFTAPPKTVFVRDIDAYPSNYNSSYAIWYGAEQVVLRE